MIRPDDLKPLLKLAKPLALLYAPALAEKAEEIKRVCAEDDALDPTLPLVEIQTGYPEDGDSSRYELEAQTGLADSQTGSLFFTSGTTGKQKGVVHAYKALLASARERIETWTMTEDDVILLTKPGNWMGGIFGILPSLISGACL